MTTSERLEDLARGVLDGAAVDWDAAEATADSEMRPAIRQLRLLERLVQVHRAEPPRWGHLEILGLLGRGAFGTVYRAWDPGLDREVALKLLRAPPPEGDRGPFWIIEEGRLLARVRHPNVVTIHGAAQINGRVGLWMELVQGQSLEALLQRGHRFGAAETIRIGLELCGAVSAVHRAGLLHRDIKAHNVVRAEDGRVVLMDLGAGREAGDRSPEKLAGTPLYLAPEVLGGGEATVQSDVYGLGVLLYHLLTGVYPVSGHSLSDLRDAHAAGARDSVRRARSDVPAALARVIDRAIDPEPSRRYGSVEAIAAGLVAIQGRRPLRMIAATGVMAVVAAAAWTVAVRGPVSSDGPRLAVLPFESGGASDQTFTNGLTQEIQRNLSALDGLVLLSYQPPYRLQASGDPVNAGRALDADFVLDGSSSTGGDLLRVHARLLRIADAQVAWSNTYNRSAEDIFAIQDDISRAIADELRVTLRLPRRHAIDFDVYYEFLQARDLHAHRSADHLRHATALFEAVVARAPTYAPAWAGIATSLADEARLRDVPYPPRMQEAAQRAIQLDEFQAEAQQAMGSLFASAGRWREADAAFSRAIETDPSLTLIYTEHVLSSLLPQHRLEEALRYLEAAERRNPLSLDVHRIKALVQVEAERYADAIETSRWVLARDREFPFANLWMGRALALSGQAEQALRHYGQQPGTEAYRGYAHAVLGHREEAERLAAALAAEPHRQMLIYGGLGDKERAFEALERVVAQNPWRAATWMIRPEVAIVRNDPRYRVIRHRLGLSDEAASWWGQAMKGLNLSDWFRFPPARARVRILGDERGR